jgi:ABC-type bacteriocin/lantibiotic exporter with double-glycine peptidase domain
MSAAQSRPMKRLWALVLEDKRDLAILSAYTLSVGAAALIVPVTAKTMVNTIASGVLIQPLVVLSAVLFGGLAFVSVLRALQLWLGEIVQARLFARTALRLAQRVPRASMGALTGVYAPELLNRFFDVLVVQKAWAKLLVDGPAAAAQILVGFALLAAYSPVFLLFDLALVAGVALVVLLGRGGLRTSLEESAGKYRVAHWLEDLAACQSSIKLHGGPALPLQRADELVTEYLLARRAHFRVLLRQQAAVYAINALALTAVFAVGGWLVIGRSLTLGQLVAAEIVVLMTLAALEKLALLVEPAYDFLAALEKIAVVEELPVEREGGRLLPESSKGMALDCRDLSFSYGKGKGVLRGATLKVAPGERVSLVGHSGVGKSTLVRLLCGLLDPAGGEIRIDGVDLADIDLRHLRGRIALVGEENEIFDGTVEENIRMGREHVSAEDIARACELTLLPPILERLPGGLQHRLLSQGRNLSLGQRQRVLIARAIVDKPRLLVLDETFTGIGESNKLLILEALLDRSKPWTVLDVSHDAEVVARSDRAIVLEDGRVVEDGAPGELARRTGSAFAALFPELSKAIRSEAA